MRPHALAIAACLVLSATVLHAQSATVAKTSEGNVHGSVLDGVASWKGIPFAAPPLGQLRWRAPQPAMPWAGVRDALEHQHDCMQLPFPSDAAPLGTTPSEDCLYLNLWRPAAATGKLPVLVWIYGGGWVNGGSSPPTYSGANLAKQGILVASFNYRLGHQRNIAAFGGDPANVTIMGESAGGVSIHVLNTSTLTEGLYQKAVIMSGANGADLGAATVVDAEALGLNLARFKGIVDDDPQALARLRAMSAEEITDGLNLTNSSGGSPPTFNPGGPIVDGTIVTHVGQAYASGAFRRVPMMIGATSGDMGGRTGFMVGGARQISGTLADKGIPTYYYRFSYVAESLTSGTAPHATDIPFFMQTQAVKYGGKTTARDNFSRQGTADLVEDPWGAEIDAAPPSRYPGMRPGGASEVNGATAEIP